MNYRHDKNSIFFSRNKTPKNNLYIWVTGLLLVVIIFFVSSSLRRSVSSVFIRFGIPLWQVKENVIDAATPGEAELMSKGDLLAENKKLQAQVYSANLKLTDFGALQKENEDLKALLGRTTGRSLVLAGILEGPKASFYDTLVIDAGDREGVKIGEKVFAEDTVLLGEVSEVYPTSSRVKLYSAPDTTIDVNFITNNSATLKLIGKGGQSYEIELPREIKVDVGTMVMTTGVNPRVVGEVEKVLFDPRDPFQKVLVASSANVLQLKTVTVERSQ